MDGRPQQGDSSEQIQLEYAPAARRRGWHARKWLLAAGVVVLIYLTAEYGPGLVRQARIQYVQSKVASFEYPHGTVIYESGTGRAPQSTNEVALTDLSVWPVKAVAQREPACWTSLKGILFPGQQFWPPGTPAPKAMVHRLRNGKGQERLVAIIVAPPGPQQLAMVGSGPPRQIGLVAAMIAPAAFGGEPVWMGNNDFYSPGFDPAKPLKVFAGKVDPANAARFSIPYEADGKSGAIEGSFDDDGEIRMGIKTGD